MYYFIKIILHKYAISFIIVKCSNEFKDKELYKTSFGCLYHTANQNLHVLFLLRGAFYAPAYV